MTAPYITRSTEPPTPEDRRSQWAAQYFRQPEIERVRAQRFDFSHKREPADPDAYLLRSAA